jgi:hypothetical protein
MEGYQNNGSNCASRGEKIEVVRLCQEESLTCEEERCDRENKQSTWEENVCGPLSPSFGAIGPPPLLGTISFKDKGKAIQVFSNSVGVDVVSFPLLKGGSSVGPGGLLNSVLDPELSLVNRLKDKQIAFLAWQENNFMLPCPDGASIDFCQESRPACKEVVVRKKPTVDFVGLPKCERFAQAVRGRKGTRRGRKKGRKFVSDMRNDDLEDSISNDSQELIGNLRGGNRSVVPISSLQIVLTEGESNRLHEGESEAYRIEAERLFNIGLNLGCSTNEERIVMIERLIDLEEKEGELWWFRGMMRLINDSLFMECARVGRECEETKAPSTH